MQSVTVRMYETYDMSTSLNKLGLIAIRTPSMPAINTRYPGLVRQFKFLSVKSCDVVLSCASTLPADPLQIGTTSGKVAPQDMFNPLLYTAVSNDSWNGILNRIYSPTGSFNSVSGSVRQFANAVPDRDAFAIYYSLLGESRFKKAYVQNGLNMRGLRPYVYPVLALNGQNAALAGLDMPTSNTYNTMYATSDGVNAASLPGSQVPANGGAIIKGQAQPMPRLQTKVYVYNQGEGDVVSGVNSIMIGGIPNTYVGCIIVPPASVNLTYFRMTVCWTVTFYDLESEFEMGLATTLIGQGSYAYSNTQSVNSNNVKAEEISDYSDTAVSADEGDIHRSVTADGVDLTLVMEK